VTRIKGTVDNKLDIKAIIKRVLNFFI
jgi:hypothetical protein